MVHCHVDSRDDGNRGYGLNPNHALQPTADRRVISLFDMKQLSILVKLILASGG